MDTRPLTPKDASRLISGLEHIAYNYRAAICLSDDPIIKARYARLAVKSWRNLEQAKKEFAQYLPKSASGTSR